MRVLLVDDERPLLSALEEVLTRDGYTVRTATDGLQGMSMALKESYDAVVLDVMLPGKNGFEVLRSLRASGRSMPIMLLTARGELPDRVLGLDSGADDYMVKPFEIEEFLARVRALTRRKGTLCATDDISFSNAVFSPTEYTITCNGNQMRLSKRETEILQYFFSNNGSVIKKESLFAKVWGYDNTADISSVEVYISFIRKKLKHIGADICITSVRGVGYRIEEGKCSE